MTMAMTTTTRTATHTNTGSTVTMTTIMTTVIAIVPFLSLPKANRLLARLQQGGRTKVGRFECGET
jgi:hypothetical protein